MTARTFAAPIAVAALALGAAAPAAAEPVEPGGPLPGIAPNPDSRSYAVSVRGVWRSTTTTTIEPYDDGGCWDERGTTVSRTVSRFASTGARRVLVTPKTRRRVLVHWWDLDQGAWPPLPVRAEIAHSGEQDHAVYDCTADEPAWTPVPPPEERNCSATLTGRVGFSLRLDRDTAELLATVDEAADERFDGCPWGDHELQLPIATAPLETARLLRRRTTTVVMPLRWRDGERGEVVERSGTVRLRFRRIPRPAG